MDALADLLSSRVKAETLRLLFGPGAGELHVREIARRAGLHEATVRQELRRLLRIGVVASRKDGNRTLYRAAPGHPLHAELRGLVTKTSGLADVLRKALASARIRAAFVFGSVAEGTEGPESDVDLMVVGGLTLRDLSKMLSGVSSRLHREVNPHVFTPKEIAKRLATRDHFVTSVWQGRKLFVVGDANDLAAVGG